MIVFSGTINSGETDVESLGDAGRIEVSSEKEDESDSVKRWKLPMKEMMTLEMWRPLVKVECLHNFFY